jgi:hypothetical protein
MNSDLGSDPATQAMPPAAPRRRGPVFSFASLLWLTAQVGLACAGAPAPSDAAAEHDPAWRAERIATLRQAIEKDHATLEAHVTRARDDQDPPVYEDPELRAIAARLTGQEDELERLEALQHEATSAP